jgi:hypothetical protein
MDRNWSAEKIDPESGTGGRASSVRRIKEPTREPSLQQLNLPRRATMKKQELQANTDRNW